MTIKLILNPNDEHLYAANSAIGAVYEAWTVYWINGIDSSKKLCELR